MKRSFVLIAALVLVLGIAGAAMAASVTVKVGVNGSNKFGPASKSINKGDKVVWKGVDGNHNVTAYSSNWSKSTTVNDGDTTSFTFRKTGVFKYRCTLHSNLSSGSCSGMCGKITVG